jgi:SAM-dependent methyltransferase
MDLLELQTSASRRHPWELVRLAFFAHTLKSLDKPVRILDAGAGDGWFSNALLPQLPSGSSITCYDINYTAENLSSLQSDAASGLIFTPNLPNTIFDVILLLDVVEHVEDDLGFLKGLVDKALTPDGTILFSIPAWPHLFSNHDRFLKHFRRYTPKQAQDLLVNSGMKINQSGGIFHSLFLARSFLVWLENKGPSRAVTEPEIAWRYGYLITALTIVILRTDTMLSRILNQIGISLPGLSWWALCQKPT